MSEHTRRPKRWAVVAGLACVTLLAGSLQPSHTVHASTGPWPYSGATGAGQAPWEHFVSIPLGSDTQLNVNMATGNLNVEQDLFGNPGVNGFDLAPTLSYNSNAAGIATDLGHGWTSDFGQDVGLKISGSTFTYVDGTGRPWTFTQTASCSFSPPAGIDATLTCSGGGYLLTDNRSGAQIQFDSNGYMQWMANREGNRIGMIYSGNNLSGLQTSEGQTISATTSNGRLQNINGWVFGYNTANNLSYVKRSDGSTVTYGYKLVGTNYLLSSVSYGLASVNINYSATNQVASIAFVDSADGNPMWTFSFGSGSSSVTDPKYHSTSYTLDSSGRVTAETFPDGKISHFTWTADNHLSSEQLPSGATTTYSYDGNNNLTQVTLPTGATASWTYGNTNNAGPYLPTSSTDTQGNTTSYSYTAGRLLNGVTDAAGHTSSATYNANGTLASATDANNHTTTYTYNTLGLLSMVSPPNPLGSESYYYTADNQLDHTIDGKGQTTTYTYNAIQQMTKVAYGDGSSQSYTYDADGNVLTSADSATGTTTYTYNALDEATQQVLPNNATTKYTSDAVGNLLTSADTTGSGGTVTYGYGPNDEVTSVIDSQNGKTTISYDQDGNQTAVAYPNGVTESMSYDPAGQLTKISATTSTGTVLTSYSYSYTNPATNTPTSQRYNVTDKDGNVTNYQYDALNRLTSALQQDGSGAQLANYAYAYDPVGNMTSQNRNGTQTAMSYNAADQLTQAGSTTYSYDANGNMTSGTGGLFMQYNAQDQVKSMTPSGGSAIGMTYNGGGQSERWTNGSNSYRYDATGVISQTTSSGATTFTNTPDGEVLSERVGGNTYYYLHDGLGSVVVLVDGSGNLVDQYSDDPYGNATVIKETVPNPFRYIGAEWDSQTGLYKMGERYYDPSIGRFTQEDPLGGGYTYAGDNPVNFTDPSGLWKLARWKSSYKVKHFKNFKHHWEKHVLGMHGGKKEWSQKISEGVYYHLAQQLFETPINTQSVTGPLQQSLRPDGMVQRYDYSTNEYGVLDPATGTIITFFKPRNRSQYWLGEVDDANAGIGFHFGGFR